mmetsp:Transcript_2231/g.3937  ORF Transcript_2231/g.3937 Transcript_2231/m.3937 type:complete len:206 (-) Transcript_2231:37-654(-)
MKKEGMNAVATSTVGGTAGNVSKDEEFEVHGISDSEIMKTMESSLENANGMNVEVQVSGDVEGNAGESEMMKGKESIPIERQVNCEKCGDVIDIEKKAKHMKSSMCSTDLEKIEKLMKKREKARLRQIKCRQKKRELAALQASGGGNVAGGNGNAIDDGVQMNLDENQIQNQQQNQQNQELVQNEEFETVQPRTVLQSNTNTETK